MHTTVHLFSVAVTAHLSFSTQDTSVKVDDTAHRNEIRRQVSQRLLLSHGIACAIITDISAHSTVVSFGSYKKPEAAATCS